MGGGPVSDMGWKRSQHFSAGKELRPGVDPAVAPSLSAPPLRLADGLKDILLMW